MSFCFAVLLAPAKPPPSFRDDFAKLTARWTKWENFDIDRVERAQKRNLLLRTPSDSSSSEETPEVMMRRPTLRQKELQRAEAARRAEEEKKGASARTEEERCVDKAAKSRGKDEVDPKARDGLPCQEAEKKGVPQKQPSHPPPVPHVDGSSRKRPSGADIQESSKKQKVVDEQPSKVGPIPPEVAVEFFARFTRPGEELPPKDVLLQDEEYTELAVRSAELCAAVNSRFHTSTEEVLKAQRKVKEYELAFEQAKKEAERALKEAADVEEKVTALTKSLEEERALKGTAEANCASLTQQLQEVKSSTDGKIREAISKARAEVKGTYEEKHRRADILMRRLFGGLFDNAMHLGQANANLELIGLLLGRNPPSLLEEKKRWEECRDQRVKAEDEFDAAASALKLLLSSGPTPSFQSRLDTESEDNDKQRKMKPAEFAEASALADTSGCAEVGASSKGVSSVKEPVLKTIRDAAPNTRSKGAA